MEFVKNLNGTAGKRCSCPGANSWLEHWEHKPHQHVTQCAACAKKAEIGGHVKKLVKRTRIILCLCARHAICVRTILLSLRNWLMHIAIVEAKYES